MEIEQNIFKVRIKELRKQNKLTQRQVADALEMSDRNYQDYEYGSINPSSISLILLSKLYGVSIDYLLGVSDVAMRNDVLIEDKLNVNLIQMNKRKITENIKSLNATGLNKVNEYINDIKNNPEYTKN